MKKPKSQFREISSYINRRETRIMAVFQFILCCLMLICLLICIAMQLHAGNIHSIFGYAMSVIFVSLTGIMLKIAYREMREEFSR